MIRTVLSFLLGLCAVVLAIGGVTATAVERTVIDEDGFVAFATPLGQDAGLQRRTVDTVVTDITGRLSLPAAVKDAAVTVVERAASSVTSDPGYPAAWQQSLRRSHAQALDAAHAAGDQGNGDQGSGDLTLDIQPIVRLAAGKVAGDVGASVVNDDPVTVDLGLQHQASTLNSIEKVAALGQPALIAAAVAALLALVLAHRRSTTVALLGVGVLLGAGALWAGLQLVQARVQGDADAAALGAYARYRLVDLAGDAAVPWFTGLAVGGAALVVVGLIGRVLTRSAHR